MNNYLIRGGLQKSDKVLLHSNLNYLFKYLFKEKITFTIRDIADSILEFLGPAGTLILPTFNFDFCEVKRFSFLDTKSQMGIFSEFLRNKNKLSRTWHPVYSFSIHGNIPFGELKKNNYSAYGKESIFHWLHLNDGKIAVIDLPDQKSMTFYHYVEEMMHVDWRFFKSFYGTYEDLNRKKSNVTANIFVRKIEDGIVTDVNNMEKLLWSKNFYKGHNLNSSKGLRTILAHDIFLATKEVINKKEALGMLYTKKKLLEKKSNLSIYD
jgi:aminoglycoside 3-N-acetyltransferase